MRVWPLFAVSGSLIYIYRVYLLTYLLTCEDGVRYALRPKLARRPTQSSGCAGQVGTAPASDFWHSSGAAVLASALYSLVLL